ncbi:hypothetical protein BDV38DRAFT_281252 [Aspergillus pseudotamarii]|uniref:Uncharacterized protein n=1 Tax=Aspergillus pseudotamarii TaxID=132259 RepID=A0A5N6SWP0_ASPPS|nr:uncharacterized protein BDV38DRAFT_281252 [Aspergillus pseudotamarii]KAE8139085.1 hypothetical protein BDV38DRAFT_281252 [Aspergillus pseudotamarii]
MENPQEPSLLEYARFYGIARDFAAVDPLTYIDETTSETPLPRDALSEFQDYIYETQRNVENDLHKEKLSVRKESARLLASVIQDARAEKLDIDWDEILPKFSQVDELKVQLPILFEDNIVDTLRYTSPLRYDENKIETRPLDESCQKLEDEDIKADILAKADQVLKDIMPEKLKCSRESMLLIQKARDCGTLPFADLEGLLDNMMISGQEEHSPSKSPLLLLSDVDETYYRSPSPASISLMSPSPASSGSFELETQCNRRSPHSDSKKSNCAVEQSKVEGSPIGDDRIQPDHKVSLDRSKAEMETVGGDSAIQATPEEDKRSEEQRFPGVSQQIGDNTNSLDSDSSVIFLMQESKCMPIGCTSTHEGSSRSSSVMIVEGECQTTSKLSDHISTFGSPSVIDSLNRDSTQYQDVQQYPISKMHSSQQPNSKNHADGYLHTFQDHGSVEDIVQTKSGQRQLSEHDTATPQLESDKTAMYASPDAAIPDTNTSSDTVSNIIDCEVPVDTVLGGQKRKHEERQDVSRKDRRLDQPLTTYLANDKCKYTLPSQSSILGSLSTFMEARGRVERRQVTAVSPYFTNNMRVEDIVGHQGPVIDARKLHEYEGRKYMLEEVQPLGLELTKQRYPQYPQLQVQNNEQPLLFLSTALLKSHLPVIQGLERLKSPPAMIYRDYDVLIRNQPVPRIWVPTQVNTKHDLPKEADIIVSPTTGIILTTLQATTQLYLPGHKPNPQTNGTKCINSPLRERIFLLAPRYKYLYVFVAHGTSSPRSGRGDASRWTADRRLLASFTSLIAFCDSMSADSTISPILISPSSDTIIGWILALAHKHAIQLSTDTVNLPQSIAFTPVNPAPKITFDTEAMEDETRWELFLRRVGLNPYAAQIILTVLRHKAETPIRNNVSSALDDVENEVSSLSRFIEMSPERRQGVFPDMIGKKIDAILEKDWQCDWALNFDY